MKGWYYHSREHSLASHGIRTKKYVVGHVRGVPIKVQAVPEGRIYPMSPAEVRKRLELMPAEDVKGLKSVEFTNPKGEQHVAWAQFLRGRKSLQIFSQPHTGPGEIDGQSAAEVNKHMKEYVLPHEIGHHKALRGGKTDKDLEVAEARADANVMGIAPFDKDVKKVVKMRKYAARRMERLEGL
jgi:hypothetical protein